MDEVIRQLKGFARGMWKYRWPGVVVAWLVSMLGVVVVFKIPDQYEASARIYVDTQSILKPLMAGLTVQPNVEMQINMLSRTLLSRPNMEKLIRMADVDLKTDSKLDQEALIEKLQREIRIQNTGRDNLYSLVFRDGDQEKSKRVIQSLVSIFVESSLGASRKDSDQAKTFLTEQIKVYERKLEEAEARLKDFRIRNIDMQTGDGKDAAGRFGEYQNQLESARLQLREAENARDAAKAQLTAERGQGADATSASLLRESNAVIPTPEMDARIESVKRNLDALLQRYTEAHPDIVAGRRLLKDLEEQKRREIAELRKSPLYQNAAAGSAQPMGASAAAQAELARMVAASEVQVASLKARVAQYTERVAQARTALKFSPQIEAEAAQLNRDYGVIKANYDALVSRRQSAVMSGELEVASGVADFRLIDPPRVSPKPVAPNRLALLPLPLLAGLAAGLFLTLAASQLRPVFMDGGDLRAKTGLPVLGVVSFVLTDLERRRERMSLYRFFAASGGLVSVFLVGLVALVILGRTG